MALDEAIPELGRLDKLGQVGVVRGLAHNGLALYDTVLLILEKYSLTLVTSWFTEQELASRHQEQ